MNFSSIPLCEKATALLQQQPPVPTERLRPEALQQRFSASCAWQREQRRLPSDSTLRKAAVLIGLQTLDAQLHVLLTQRPEHLDVHPGQIAFPGGKMDAHDLNATATALREAQEEVGLRAENAQVLGTLPVYSTNTGFCITPVVALLSADTVPVANTQEVSEIFYVPLSFLMNPAHHRKHIWPTQTTPSHKREWFSMPYRPVGTQKEYFIYGVTAGILRDFYQFLMA